MRLHERPLAGISRFTSVLTRIKGFALALAKVVIAQPAHGPFLKPARITTMAKRDEYIAKMKLQLDELDAKMDKLEAKAKEAKEDARNTRKKLPSCVSSPGWPKAN